MLTGNTLFESELKKIVGAEIERLKDILADGQVVKSFDEYRQIQGQIFAHRRVLGAYCDEVNTIISKR